jgi:hypothetical protein
MAYASKRNRDVLRHIPVKHPAALHEETNMSTEPRALRPVRTPATIAALLASAFLIFGCADVTSDAPEDVEATREPLYYAPGPASGPGGTAGAGGAWANGKVPVCYAPYDGNNPGLLAEAKTLLADSWAQAAKLSFVDWGPCKNICNDPDLPSAVRVRFASGSSGNTDWRGTKSAITPSTRCDPVCCLTPGFVEVELTSSDTDRYHQHFRYEVIHEFGHVLGFAHEQERPDNWNGGTAINCNQLDDGRKAVTGGTYETPYDDASIMNYCATDPLLGGNWVTALSSGDITGVRKVYGRNPAAHGFMIRSDSNTNLAVNATNGATEGTVLTLSDACTIDNPDCTWSYKMGMLLSDRDPTLAIISSNGAAEGHVLKLTHQCSTTNLDCKWIYQHGEFLSEHNTALAINAWGGAYPGTTLVVTGQCSAANSDCTWTLPNVMLSSARNTTLGVNAWYGATNGASLALHNACTADNPDCTWTFWQGMMLSSRNNALAVNAVGGAVDGARIAVVNNCGLKNPDCTWSWKDGELISDNNRAGVLPINAVGGALHGTSLSLATACTASNVDCVFSGLFAANK